MSSSDISAAPHVCAAIARSTASSVPGSASRTSAAPTGACSRYGTCSSASVTGRLRLCAIAISSSLRSSLLQSWSRPASLACSTSTAYEAAIRAAVSETRSEWRSVPRPTRTRSASCDSASRAVTSQTLRIQVVLLDVGCARLGQQVPHGLPPADAPPDVGRRDRERRHLHELDPEAPCLL